MGYQTGAELNVKDTFYLGRTAHMQNKPEVAIKWLEEAALQAAADGGRIVEPTQVKLGNNIGLYFTKISLFIAMITNFLNRQDRCKM